MRRFAFALPILVMSTAAFAADPTTCTQAGDACKRHFAIQASTNADVQIAKYCIPVVANCMSTGNYLGGIKQYYGLEKR